MRLKLKLDLGVRLELELKKTGIRIGEKVCKKYAQKKKKKTLTAESPRQAITKRSQKRPQDVTKRRERERSRADSGPRIQDFENDPVGFKDVIYIHVPIMQAHHISSLSHMFYVLDLGKKNQPLVVFL